MNPNSSNNSQPQPQPPQPPQQANAVSPDIVDKAAANKGPTVLGTIIHLIHFALAVYAVYLSFKCKGGAQAGDLLLAICCSPFYIAYRLALGC